MLDWVAQYWVAVLVGGIVVGLALRILLFIVGCALADAGEPSFLRACGYVVLVVAVSGGIGAGIFWGLYSFDGEVPGLGPWRIGALGLAAVVGWLAGAVSYQFLLPTTFKKSALVAAFEVLLFILLSALIAGLVAVAFAVAQLLNPTQQQQNKTAQAPVVHVIPADRA